MNRTYQLITAVALLCTSASSFAQTGSYVPAYAQEQSNWCWAGCEQMLYWAYKPGTITQCALVGVSRDKENSAWLWFSCDNLSSSTADPCSSPLTFNSPQAMYGCDGSIENVMDHYSVSSTGYGYAFSAADVASATAARKHMVARWGWNSGGGHFVVIYRYTGGNVSFNNPGSGSSYTWTYNSFSTSQGNATWTHTLRMDNTAPYGSIYYRQANPNTATTGATEPVINFYPNPASNRVNLVLDNTGLEQNKVNVYTTTGQLQFTTVTEPSTRSSAMDVSSWPRGVYLVQVNGQTLSRKLVLQ